MSIGERSFLGMSIPPGRIEEINRWDELLEQFVCRCRGRLWSPGRFLSGLEIFHFTV